VSSGLREQGEQCVGNRAMCAASRAMNRSVSGGRQDEASVVTMWASVWH